MKFCPQCGADLSARARARALRSLTPRHYGLIGSAALALFGLSIGLQEYIHWKRGDQKPTQEFQREEQPAAEDVTDDPQLNELRQQVAAAPGDVEKLRALAAYLGDKLRNRPDAPPPLVFEAIDTLSQILKSVPDDPDALLMMADVSFDQRAFQKAIEFYERYLKLSPDDLGARSRYASTLTFIGRYDDSVKELNTVLQRDPKNFPAMAYLAITYAQQGNTAKAKELATTALTLAPSDEARARFSSFVTSLDSAKASGPATNEPASSAAEAPAQTGVAAIVAAVQRNPVAGPKFIRYDDKAQGELRLYFQNFPMQQMPPFAKEKFFSGIRDKVKQAGVPDLKRIVFLDADNGTVLDTLDIAAS
jgi:tetratricopeptide (TPR) repeat protein